MSAGLLFREALLAVRRLDLPSPAESDLLAVLEAGRSGPLQFFFDALAEARVVGEPARRRGAAVYFCYCAGQLADDLADGDCDYLEAPHRTGPSAQFILQNLFFRTGVSAGLEPAVLHAVAGDLARGAGAQHIEVRTVEWSEPTAREVAEGISGLQFSAYLRLLWAGTALAECASRIGLALGIAAHVAHDVHTRDPRFWGLAEDERASLLVWARDRIGSLREEKLASVDAVLRSLERLLAEGA